MDEAYTKTCNYAILSIVLIVAVIAVGANSNPVLAQVQPCTAQLGYPVMPSTYYGSNVPIVIPTSATCATNYGTQLYATGNAYDATSNIGLGSVSTVLQSVDGGTTFNGQLSFDLPSSTQGHTVQISVSIYNGQYGNLISSNSETIQVGAETQQIATTTVTQASPYPYPTQYTPPPTYLNETSYPDQASSFQQPSQQRPYRHQSQYQSRNHNNSLLGYVAIAAILAAVIIVTAGIVVYGRRGQQPAQVTWVPWLPPPR